MSLRFIHILDCVRIFFLFKTASYSLVCIYHILLLHSFIRGHSTIVNNAAMNMGIQILLQVPDLLSLKYIHGSEIAGL